MKKTPNPYSGYRYPVEIISHAVLLYFRFALSFRDVEEILAARGIAVSYEAIRQWCLKFGQRYANKIRHRCGNLGDTWFLDEVFISINGLRHYLWRAVDQDGDVLDILVQKHRDKRAAKRFFRKLLKGMRYSPRVIVTDKLRSYGPAKRTANAPIQIIGSCSAFSLCSRSPINNLFRVGRHHLQAGVYRFFIDRAFNIWREVTCAPDPALSLSNLNN